MAPDARGHELIEHTADVGLRVWAPTVGELFIEAATGLIDVMGTSSAPADREERVVVDGADLESLMVDWLSEVVFLFDARGFVTQRGHADVALDPARVEATLSGSGIEGFRQHGPAVKAVTYHLLEVRERDDGYEARVYLDV